MTLRTMISLGDGGNVSKAMLIAVGVAGITTNRAAWMKEQLGGGKE